MKHAKMTLILFVLSYLLSFSQHLEAQIVIPHSILSSGGGVASNGRYQIVGTVGQPMVGVIGNSTHTSSTGFWSFSIHLITSVEQIPGTVIPKEFHLAQNYPNPFNPSTTIQFALPGQAEVTIRLYDLLGREVATLVNEEYQPGEYKLLFEAGELASGVYFYRIRARDSSGKGFVRTRKLTFLK